MATALRIFVLLLFSAFTVSTEATEAETAESRPHYRVLSDLKKQLLNDYDRDVIPIVTAGTPVSVQLGLSIIDVSVDHDDDELDISGWTVLAWKDARLVWDPASFDGITQIRIPASKLWLPDFTIYNSARHDESMFVTHKPVPQALLNNSGEVLVVPPRKYTVRCNFTRPRSLTEETCHVKFGSWVTDKSRLDPDFYNGIANVNVDYLNPNRRWEVKPDGATKTDKVYPCCKETFPDLTFNLKLKHRVHI